MEALKKLGIADQVQAKLKAVGESREAEEAVAKGETDLFLGPELSDKLVDGIDLVGGLPKRASTPIDVVGFVSTHATDPKAAERFWNTSPRQRRKRRTKRRGWKRLTRAQGSGFRGEAGLRIFRTRSYRCFIEADKKDSQRVAVPPM